MKIKGSFFPFREFIYCCLFFSPKFDYIWLILNEFMSDPGENNPNFGPTDC